MHARAITKVLEILSLKQRGHPLSLDSKSTACERKRNEDRDRWAQWCFCILFSIYFKIFISTNAQQRVLSFTVELYLPRAKWLVKKNTTDKRETRKLPRWDINFRNQESLETRSTLYVVGCAEIERMKRNGNFNNWKYIPRKNDISFNVCCTWILIELLLALT